MEITRDQDDEVLIFVNSMGSTHDENQSDRYMRIVFIGRKYLDYEIFRYTNRVDDLYASWPAIMTINSTWGRYILEPLLRYQFGTNGQYAIADLGNCL